MGMTPLIRYTLHSVDVRMQVMSLSLYPKKSQEEEKGFFFI